MDHTPVLPPGPSFRNAHHGQVQHFLQAVIGGENGLSLGHLNSHAQDVFPAIQIDTDGNVYCFLHNLPFAADVEMDGVQKDHSVDGFQGPLPAIFDGGQNLVGNPADDTIWNRNAIDVLDVSLNISCSHPLGVHRQDFPQCPD